MTYTAEYRKDRGHYVVSDPDKGTFPGRLPQEVAKDLARALNDAAEKRKQAGTSEGR